MNVNEWADVSFQGSAKIPNQRRDWECPTQDAVDIGRITGRRKGYKHSKDCSDLRESGSRCRKHLSDRVRATSSAPWLPFRDSGMNGCSSILEGRAVGGRGEGITVKRLRGVAVEIAYAHCRSCESCSSCPFQVSRGASCSLGGKAGAVSGFQICDESVRVGDGVPIGRPVVSNVRWCDSDWRRNLPQGVAELRRNSGAGGE